MDAKLWAKGLVESLGYSFEIPDFDNEYHSWVDENRKAKGFFIGFEKADFACFTVRDWTLPEDEARHTFRSKEILSQKNQRDLARLEKKSMSQAQQKALSVHKNLEQIWRKDSPHFTFFNHDYLTRKNIPENVLKFCEFPPQFRIYANSTKEVVFPLFTKSGEVWNEQTIYETGEKRFQPGGKTKETFYVWNLKSTPFFKTKHPKILLCEGIATGFPAWLTLNIPVVCAGSASNLEKAYLAIKHLADEVFTLADWDRKSDVNVGFATCENLKEKYGVQTLLPELSLPDTSLDLSDTYVTKGTEHVKDVLEKQFEKFQKPQDLEVPRTTGISKNFGSASTGFWNISEDGKKATPNFEDLLSYFHQQTHFITFINSQRVFGYKDGLYTEISREELKAFCYETMNPKPAVYICEEFQRRVELLNNVREDFFVHEGKLNLANGILDLNTKKLTPHSPNFGFLYKLPYDFDETKKAPKFEALLDRITVGRKNLSQLLLEYMGYTLCSPTCFLEKGMLLLGDGANGKTTLLQILKAVLGSENYTVLNLQQIKDQRIAMMLVGKLANIANETPSYALKESNVFKDLVSGGEIIGRQLYKNAFSFNNTAKLYFACNRLPTSGDDSHGLLRKMLIVPFDATFSTQDANFDPKIASKIVKEELSGILNLILQAWQNLSARGKFERVEAIEEVLEDYKYDLDPFDDWFEQHVVKDPVGFLESKEAFDNYRFWLEIKRRSSAQISFTAFSMTLSKKLGQKAVRKRDGSARKRGHVGHRIMLKM